MLSFDIKLGQLQDDADFDYRISLSEFALFPQLQSLDVEIMAHYYLATSMLDFYISESVLGESLPHAYSSNPSLFRAEQHS